MKTGAARPDISRPQALKEALLKAKAGGASGVYFAKLLERMGIAEQMKAKTKSPPAGGFSGELLLSGEAELAVQQKPELMHVAGTEIVGFLPGELNMVTEFAAAIMAGRKDARTGKMLCDVAIARGGGGVPVERSRSALTVTPASLPDSRSAI